MRQANSDSQPTKAGEAVWASLPWPPRRLQVFDAMARLAKRDQDSVGPLPPVKRNSSRVAPSASVREDAPVVLVVDDVHVNRRVAELVLKRLGYRTAIADSGLAALEILTRTVCAAVLMDCHMPEM